MQVVRYAIDAVQRNLFPLALYAVASLILNGSGLAWELSAERIQAVTSLDSAATSFIGYGFDLLTVILFALLQCLVFSRMGREIDQPLWKIADDRESIHRFFSMWFLFNLTVLLPVHLSEFVYARWGDKAVGVSVLLLLAYVSVAVILVPVGACFMFRGRFELRHAGDILGPLARQPGATGLILALNLAQFLLYLLALDAEKPLSVLAVSSSAVYVVGAYIDCVVFAGAWIICIIDRNTVEEPDFDL